MQNISAARLPFGPEAMTQLHAGAKHVGEHTEL